jgi:hypothetical protein
LFDSALKGVGFGCGESVFCLEIMAFAVNSNSFNVFLTSDGCLKRYPQNRPNDFWITLQNEKVLSNSAKWQVGIQTIHFDSDLYNLGKGTDTFFMFLFKGFYHVVDLPPEFVATPEAAVDLLNASLRKYCMLNSQFFQDTVPLTEKSLRRMAPPTEIEEAYYNLMAPSSSAAFMNRVRPVHDKDLDEEIQIYNEFATGVKRQQKILEDKWHEESKKSRQGGEELFDEEQNELPQARQKRAVSENLLGRDVLKSGRDVLKSGLRAVSEEPKISKPDGSLSDPPFNSETLLRFFVDSKTRKVYVRIGLVNDFGMSQMLRFMLGFHSRKKVFQESFEFRKSCRLFLKTLAKKFDLVSAVEKDETMLHPYRVRKSTVQDRDLLYRHELGGFGYDKFFEEYGHLLESELKSLIVGNEEEYSAFVSRAYLSSRRMSALTFEGRPISFFLYSVIDFIFYTVSNPTLDGPRSRTSNMIVKSDGAFKPHIFDRLYVYSNIVKPVDYDDRQIRLMDIVYLQPKTGGNYGVVDYRSVVFQEVDVDVLRDIHILITTSLGTPAPFMHGPMCLTLQFRRGV